MLNAEFEQKSRVANSTLTVGIDIFDCQPVLDMFPLESLPATHDKIRHWVSRNGRAIYDHAVRLGLLKAWNGPFAIELIDDIRYSQYIEERAFRESFELLVLDGEEWTDYSKVWFVNEAHTERIFNALFWRNGDDIRERLDVYFEGEFDEHFIVSEIVPNIPRPGCDVLVTLKGVSVRDAEQIDPENLNGCLTDVCFSVDGNEGPLLIEEQTYAAPLTYWGWHSVVDEENKSRYNVFLVPTPIQNAKAYARRTGGPRWNILCIVGRTGSGKTTIREYLKKAGLRPWVTYTTRKKRPGEVDGIDYHFVTKEAAESMENKFLVTKFGDVEYFAVKDDICKADMIVVDPNGLRELRKTFPDVSFVDVEITVDAEVRQKRLVRRGDDPDLVSERICAEDARFVAYEKNRGHLSLANYDAEATARLVFMAFAEYIYC